MPSPAPLNSAFCPEPPTLQRLLLGQLSGDDAEQLEFHLSTCESCAATAARLADSDELIDAVQAARELSEDESASKLIARLKAMRADSVHTQLDDTTAPTPSSSSDFVTLELVDSQPHLTGELSFLEPPQSEDEIGRLGRFRVLEILGRGGMGVVLRAEDPKLRREVAIKVLNLKSVGKSDAAARFLREAQATAAIDHDNIVTIHDVGEQQGMPYYAMQFLRGEALYDRLAREKQLPIEQAVRIAREVAQGLSAAHAVGLLHRDIKPANIWLEEGTDRAKIVDFGLARIDDHDDSDLTNSGAILGTPKYMSPEQAQGQPVDQRCDLFSLGSVLYHLVAGQPPFSGSNITATLISVANGSYEDIHTHRPDCPEGLQAIIDQLLKKSPDDRFATADEVVAALQGVEDELAIAPPPIPNLIPPATSPSQGHSRYAKWVALAAVPLFILLGVVFLWRTPQGDLRVEVNDPNVQVIIDGKQLTLNDKLFDGKKRVGKHRLKLKLGNQEIKLDPQKIFKVEGDDREHQITVQLNGAKLSSNEFEITRDRETVLTIALLPRNVPIDDTSAASGEAIESREGGNALSLDEIVADGIIWPREGWVDLVSLVDIEKDANRWVQNDEGLHCPPRSAAKLRLPIWIRGAYELTADVTHRSGDAGPIFILPVGRHTVCAYVACRMARVGVVSGLSLVAGVGPKDNPTGRREESTLGQRVKIRIRVEPDGPNAKITMWKNDELYREWTVSEDALSVDDAWAFPAFDQPGIGSSESTLVWHDVRMRMLSGKAGLLRPSQSDAGKSKPDVGPGWDTTPTDKSPRAGEHIVGARLNRVLGETTERPKCIAISPDGKLAAVGLHAGEFEWWNLQTNERLAISTLTKPQTIRHLQFLPTGNRLIVQHVDGNSASVWDVESRKKIGEAHNVRNFALSPDGKYILGSNDAGGVGYVASSLTEKFSHTPQPFVGKKYRHFSFLPGGYVAAIRDPHHLSIIDPKQFDGLLKEIELPESTERNDPLHDIATTADGRAVVFGRYKTGLYWVDLESKKTTHFPPDKTASDPDIPPRQPYDNSILARHAENLICIPGPEQEPLTLIDGDVVRFDLSEDRRFILTSSGYTLKLWDLLYSSDHSLTEGGSDAGGRKSSPQPVDLRLNRTIGKRDGYVTTLAVSPDEKTVVVGFQGGKLQWWDLTGEREPETTQLPNTAAIWGLQFTPDGKRLFVSHTHGERDALYAFDTQTRKPIGQAHSMARAKLSPNGSLVIGRSSVGTPFLLDAQTLRKSVLPPSMDKRKWWNFAFIDEQRVAAATLGDEKRFLTVVNLKTGEFEQEIELPSDAEGNDHSADVGLTGNGRFALVGHARSGVKVIDLTSGKLVDKKTIVSIPTFEHHTPQGGGAMFGYGFGVVAVDGQSGQLKQIRERHFHHVTLTRDGRKLIATNDGGLLNVWDVLYFPALDTANTSPTPPENVQGKVEGAAVDREIVDLRLNRELPALDAKVNCLAVSPDAATLVAGLANGDLQWWDLTGKEKPQTTTTGQRQVIIELWFDPTGKRLFVEPNVSARSGVQVWDVASRKHVNSLKQMAGFAMSPDGMKLIGHSETDEPKLLDGETFEKLALPPALTEKKLKTFTFLPDNRVAATTITDEKHLLLVVNLATGKVEHEVEMPDRSPRGDVHMDAGTTADGKFALFGRRAAGIDVFDPAEGKFISSFKEHSGSLKIDRNFTASGGALFMYTGRLGVVHPQTGQIKKLANGNFFQAALTPNGRQLIAFNQQSKLNVWDVLYFPPIKTDNDDAQGAARFAISTGGLVADDTITPEGKTPDRWQHDDDFAEINGKGELQFPRLEVTEFALDIDITVRDPHSDLLIMHRAPHDRWRSEVRLAHTEPDDDGKLLRVLPIRRRGGQLFMPGHTNAPLNEKFRLTIAAGEDALCVYINGQRRLRQQEVQPDLHLTLSANSQSADATIHHVSYRPLTEAERNDLEREPQ